MEEDLFGKMWEEVFTANPNIEMPQFFAKLGERIKTEYGESETARSLFRDLNNAEAEYYDGHSCSANADSYGFCQVCGAVVSGTMADYDIHGYDPPESNLGSIMSIPILGISENSLWQLK